MSERMSALKASRDAKPYQRQKLSLQRQIESYLWSLPGKKSLNSASPNDVISFLVWCDKFGKTVSHLNDCSGKESCNCPKMLAAGTIDNNIGKLRTIFKEAGRGSFWNDDLQLGNPASHSSVKNYHTMVLEEQAISRTFTKQAVPMFLDKLNILCSYLIKQVVLLNIKPVSRFILARDLAFFSLDFFSGDRGSDLGRVKSSDVLSLEDGEGFLVNQAFGKTLRGNTKNVFGVKPIPSSPYCLVKNLTFYVSLAGKMSVDLKSGYLFRVSNHQGNIVDAPFAGSAVSNRLKGYLNYLSLDDGETMHSLRSDCSITLLLLGVPYTEVAKLVGWKSVHMATYYCQFDSVMADNNASSVLLNAARQNKTASSSAAESLGKDFRQRNHLEGYKPLFL